MINPTVLRSLLAAGASAEMIVLAVEADYNSRKEQREKDATRKRMSRGLLRTSPSSPPMINNSTPSPTSDLAKAKSIKSASEGSFFESFWAVYPRKIGKGAARKAYRNALKRASAEEIAAGAKAYAASKPDPQYTAHASTWLNADRWLDEPDHKPSTVLSGPWKPIEPEKMPEPISPAELARRQEQIRKAMEGLKRR
jgi:hypothetical protein